MRSFSLIIIIFSILPLAAVFGQELPERYHTYQEVVDTLTTLGTRFGEIMYVDTMGYSQRDSIPMLRVKISDNPAIDEDEPALFFDGGVHADEVLSVEVTMNLIYNILQRYEEQDTTVIRYIEQLEIFMIPFINPEGHIVVEGGNLVWRKNKSDNDSNGIFTDYDGVDNNRNYDFGWEIDTGPEATTPESLMFKGYAPFTESENRAMADFGWKYRPLIALDYHSPTYGRSEVAYYPWYWYPNQGGHGFSPDETMMHQICDEYCGLIINDAHDSTYEARRALVNKGDFKTYYYGNFGTIAFSVEVSDTTIQDPGMVDDIVARHLPSQYYMMERALGAGISGIIRDSVTLEPLEAEVRVMEHHNEDLNPRLSRPDFGRYRRILAPGTYTLRFTKDDYVTQYANNVRVYDSQTTVTDILLVPEHPRPPAPDLVYPEDGDTLEVNMFTFRWSEVELADFYLIEVTDDPSFDSVLFADSTLTQNRLRIVVPVPNGDYYWRIKGGNDNGWGPYSEVWSFRIDHIVGIYEPASGPPRQYRLLQNHPNPFNDRTSIGFDMPADGHVEIKAYNLAGQEVDVIFEGNLKAGRHNITYDAPDLSSGIYFCRLTARQGPGPDAGGFTDIKKMVLLK